MTAIEWGEGLVLRYGGFYGPGTTISQAPDAVMAAAVRKRRFPIIGDGSGVFSHIHVDDAAAARVAAVEHGEAGICNVVDDEPAPVRAPSRTACTIAPGRVVKGRLWADARPGSRLCWMALGAHDAPDCACTSGS